MEKHEGYSESVQAVEQTCCPIIELRQYQATYDRHADALSQSPAWRDEISETLARKLKKPPEFLHLSPTARSELRG